MNTLTKDQVETLFGEEPKPVTTDEQKPVAVAQYLLRTCDMKKGEYIGQALSPVRLYNGRKIVFQEKRYKIVNVSYVRKGVDNRNIATVKLIK